MVEIRCKGCGKKLLSYDKTSFRRYKTPVKKCKKCGRVYADPRCHEIAIEGIPSDTFSVKSHMFLIVFGMFLIYRGIHTYSWRQLDVIEELQWVMPGFLLLAGLICVVGGIYEIIAICSGIKKKRFDKLRRESEERLKDEEYVRILNDLGYRLQDFETDEDSDFAK